MPERTALFLSPHLDDVAFSCGGLLALLADAGWHTIMATVFTRSVLPARGFALACQLDKGLPADADYMALRREEDRQAASILHATGIHWIDLPEAPHRGYGSAAELFTEIRQDDMVASSVEQALQSLDASHAPDLVLAPQALGRHVDHQVVAASASTVFDTSRLAWYRDTPYAIREPAAVPVQAALAGATRRIDISSTLPRKIAACCAYASQIGFQFGGAERLAATVRGFALQEGCGQCEMESFRMDETLFEKTEPENFFLRRSGQ